MTTTNHTKWYEANAGMQGLITDVATGRTVAVSYAKEDARLIAAAPELLDALWAMVTSFHAVEYMESHMQQSAAMARAAIAKATGEQP